MHWRRADGLMKAQVNAQVDAQENAQTTEMPAISSVASSVREHARRVPDRVAVHFQGESLTFADIDRRSNQVARALQDATHHGSRVGILAKNTPTFYELVLGAAKVGVVLVPINYRLAPAEIAFILNDANVELLFVGSDFADAIGQVKESLSDLRQLITIDGPDYPSAEYSAWRDRHPGTDFELDIDTDDVGLQVYTSGTTGRPKGVPLTNANVREALKARLPAWGPWGERDVIHVCMPQYHLGAIMWGFGGLCQGVESVLTREFRASEALELIQRYRVTKTSLASVMMKMIMDDPACESADFSALELLIYGASSTSQDLVRRAQRAFRCGLAQGYGMTESAGSISYMSPADSAGSAGDRLKSAGKALEGVDIRIYGPNGSTLPPGETGEVICRGGQVMNGYWKLPEASAEVLRDGWLHSGDAGYLDEDGYLYIVDRIKDMIVSGGENIYSAEVEAALSAHSAVKETAVIAVPDDHWGEVPKAFVVVEPGTVVTEKDVIEFVRERIAHYKAPKSVEFVDSLPRNASGKVLKRELRAPYWKKGV
jgi:acyl-CoA synthetase (AMP-forming)/AMP-acid ligase II